MQSARYKAQSEWYKRRMSEKHGVRRIAVIGAGYMGGGIAAEFALRLPDAESVRVWDAASMPGGPCLLPGRWPAAFQPGSQLIALSGPAGEIHGPADPS